MIRDKNFGPVIIFGANKTHGANKTQLTGGAASILPPRLLQFLNRNCGISKLKDLQDKHCNSSLERVLSDAVYDKPFIFLSLPQT